MPCTSGVRVYFPYALPGSALEEDRKVIARFEQETAAMRAEITELQTKVQAPPTACTTTARY